MRAWANERTNEHLMKTINLQAVGGIAQTEPLPITGVFHEYHVTRLRAARERHSPGKVKDQASPKVGQWPRCAPSSDWLQMFDTPLRVST